MKKNVPERFPSNEDSIGIELVGGVDNTNNYEPATQAQNDSLRWLVQNLSLRLGIFGTEIFRHPTVSRKNASEASTAKW